MNDWMKAVEYHHSYVKAMADEHNDYQVIWTSLIGSQNYNLENENSDCDTFSIVLPNYFDFISNTNLISFETEIGDGKCVVKDFRLMMNLLRKTSPNSIEVFSSKYKVFEPEYKEIEKQFFSDSETMFYLIHANYKNMLNAIAGMCYQLHGRNMSDGKRYSHALHLDDMRQLFTKTREGDILSFRHKAINELALIAKFQPATEQENIFYREETMKIADVLKAYSNKFEYTDAEKRVEYLANNLINRLQFEVTKIYLEQNNFSYKE